MMDLATHSIALSPPLFSPHILFVEDDREISALVSRYLRANGCRVTCLTEGRDLLQVIEDGKVDLIVLDIMLPGEDGLSLCRKLRTRSNVPIVIISARGDEIDRVIGLEIGADDYLGKPFGPRELLARMRAILRRLSAGTDPQGSVRRSSLYKFLGWRLDTVRRTLTSPAGAFVALTGAEFELLCVLCERPMRVLSRDLLMELTQGRSLAAFERSVDILISRLRSKIGMSDGASRFIQTIRSGGYMFTAEVTSE